MSGVVAGALAGCVAALLVPGGPAGRRPGHRPSVALVAIMASALVALGGWWVATEPQTAALGGIVGGVAVAVARMVARHRSDRDAARARRRVLEVCDGLHAELTAGQ
uniref:hypothetical protein n=1 Tax=Nocardioides stalactiti TaxID=2755356 RepID=UPI0035E43E5D